LKEQNCPWGKLTFERAVERGIPENIQWLKDNNCPQ
jgi:hypothetical protein